MKKEKKKICRVKGCNRIVHVIKHGLCHAHVTQYYRYGQVVEQLRKYEKHPDFTG